MIRKATTRGWMAVFGLSAALASVAFGCDSAGKASADKEAEDDDKDDKKKKDKDKDKGDDDKDDKKKKSKDKDDGSGDDKEAKGDTDGDAERPAKEGIKAGGAVTSPEQQSYPLSAVTTVADNCSTPSVIMATAPESVGADYEWTWTRQAMLANGQYKVVRQDPTAPGQVAFDVHQAGEGFSRAFVLLAKCHDGATCNHLAAMYKAVVKSSKPQVVCGKLPMELSASTRKKSNVSMGEGGESDLPATSDVIGLCARLSACMIADKPTLDEDPGSACQKGPSNFKTACARNFPCAEVLACLDR